MWEYPSNISKYKPGSKIWPQMGILRDNDWCKIKENNDEKPEEVYT